MVEIRVLEIPDMCVGNNGNETLNVKNLIDEPSNKNIGETSNKNTKDWQDKDCNYPGRKSQRMHTVRMINMRAQ